ncbi:uncharacterized protein STEHIDRAFT_107476 [Stereum hirsutum FP-91666 SS1]|uniref:uncharacterized protein n=1 Tax=Stereum hirsutum (strain FP-91666) TaxID=721885 RepID=UPI000440F31C|nr:uncharacterized protein STEHIDRAFT_107476 [Stereum hirsutum FP-91666 SS1]EIM90725.1 hypothetical protein STEHIDRAFT_107476 [Stereum hirsutum FP-91666 SS1]
MPDAPGVSPVMTHMRKSQAKVVSLQLRQEEEVRSTEKFFTLRLLLCVLPVEDTKAKHCVEQQLGIKKINATQAQSCQASLRTKAIKSRAERCKVMHDTSMVHKGTASENDTVFKIFSSLRRAPASTSRPLQKKGAEFDALEKELEARLEWRKSRVNLKDTEMW